MLNVSHTTVSRSLNDSPLISQETKERVKELAKAYGYTPNVNARSLVLAKSYNLGLFFSTLQAGTTANFFLEAVRGVNKIVKGQYNLAVEAIDDLKSYDGINKRSFDGVMLMSQSPHDDAFIAHILREQIPLVVLNREIQGQKVSSVLADDLVGAYNATRYIVQQGHTAVAVIEGKAEFRTTLKRKQGYLDALSEAGIAYRNDYAVSGNYDVESGYTAMKKILNLADRPTAVFCFNDDMAVGAMKALNENGLTVPQDMSIVGYDDNGFTAYLSPALTTVKRPIELLGSEGAKMILKKMETGDGEAPEKIMLKTELIVRESVRKKLKAES